MNLCSAEDDKLKIYKENFEKAYLEATEEFYQARTAEYLAQNGVINYMTYVWLWWSRGWGQVFI